MLKIGEFSKMAKITVSALRYYDKMGLLQPVFTDEDSSYRYYSEEQLADVLRIVELREIGLSIREIRAVLRGDDLAPVLEHRKIEIEQELSALYGQQKKLEALLREPNGETRYSASVRRIPEYTVFLCSGVIRTGDMVHDFMLSCHREFRRMNPDIPYAVPDYCCMIYPEDAYQETNIRVEYAQAVAYAGRESGLLKFRTLPGIDAVTVEHCGSYRNLRNAYSFALRWTGEHNLRICGAPREQYVNGSWNRGREEDWLTVIQLPVTGEEA